MSNLTIQGNSSNFFEEAPIELVTHIIGDVLEENIKYLPPLSLVCKRLHEIVTSDLILKNQKLGIGIVLAIRKLTHQFKEIDLEDKSDILGVSRRGQQLIIALGNRGFKYIPCKLISYDIETKEKRTLANLDLIRQIHLKNNGEVFVEDSKGYKILRISDCASNAPESLLEIDQECNMHAEDQQSQLLAILNKNRELIIYDRKTKSHINSIHLKQLALPTAIDRIEQLCITKDRVTLVLRFNKDKYAYCVVSFSVNSKEMAPLFEPLDYSTINAPKVIVDNERLYIFILSSKLVAHDPKTGKQLWEYSDEKSKEVTQLDDKTLVIESDQKILTISSDTGELLHTMIFEGNRKDISLSHNIIALLSNTGIYIWHAHKGTLIKQMQVEGWVNIRCDINENGEPFLFMSNTKHTSIKIGYHKALVSNQDREEQKEEIAPNPPNPPILAAEPVPVPDIEQQRVSLKPIESLKDYVNSLNRKKRWALTSASILTLGIVPMSMLIHFKRKPRMGVTQEI